MNCETCKYFILTCQDRRICKKYAVYVEDWEDCEGWEAQAEVNSRPACFGQYDDVIKVCTGSCSYVSECAEAADPYPAARKSKEVENE